MNRLIAMGRPLVLGRPGGLFAAQVVIGVQGPVRVAQQFTRQQDQVGLTGAQYMLGLRRLGDHAYRAGSDA